MDEKLNDLIYEIQNLVRTLGSSGQSKPKSSDNSSDNGLTDKRKTDKSITNLIAALGILSSKLGGAARNRKEEIRAANDFATSVTVAANRAEKAAKKQEKAAEDKKQADREAAEQLRILGLSAKQAAEEQVNAAKKIKQDALQAARNQKDAANAELATSINKRRYEKSSSREVYEAAQRTGSGLSQLNDKFLDLGKGSLAAQVGLQGISAVVGGAAKALLNYSSAIQNGERGAKLSGKALEDFANPILDTISTLGTLAMVLPGVGKYFGQGASQAAKLAGRFMKLGGATAVAGAEVAKFGIKFVQAGLTQADKVFDSFQKLSQVGIAGAGGMDDVFGMMQELGLSSGEIEKFNTLIAANAQTIKFLGATATDGANQLAKVAGGLYKSKLGRQLEIMGVNQTEQNELALINLSIEARSIGLQKIQNRSTEESNAVLGKFVKELDMAAQLTGTSRKEQADARAAALTDERFRAAIVDAKNRGDQQEIDRLNKASALAAIAEKAGDKRGAVGIRQLAAGGGAMSTTEAVAAQQTYGVNEILASQGTVMDAVEQMVANGRISQAALAGVNKYIGTIQGIQTDVVGQADLLDKLGPALDAVKNENITLEQYFKREQDKREAPKPGTDTPLMVDSLRMQQNAALIQDQAAKQLSSAATVHSVATTAFEAAVKKFGEVTGTMPKSQITTGGAEVEAAKKAAYSEKQYAEARKKAEEIGSMSLFKPTEEDIERTAQALLRKMPKYAAGGIAAGPDSGHLAMLHGTEAVIPLAGGAIPVAISGGSAGKGDVGSGPAFSKANEFAAQMDKVIKALDDSNKYLSDIYDEISGGATVGGAGSGSGERVAQEALAEHDHAHPHEPAAAASPEVVAMVGKIVNPLEKMTQTSGMMRNDGKTYHGGIDLAGKIGDKIMAPISGMARVLSEKESGGYGNMVEVTDATTGVKHMLAHMDKTMVKTGDVIKAGQQIGTLGNTGKSTGAHLHHEMRDKAGNKIDPSQFYNKGPGDTFGSTAGGAATGYPQMVPKGRRGAAGATAPITGGVKDNLAMMTKALQEQGINDPKMINATLASVMKETGGKINAEEDLAGYANTSNERIRSLFGARAGKKTDKELDAIKKDPKQFAEMMYGKDSGMGLGNTEEGDAYKYRGRGAVQLTGKANYASASKDLFGDDRLVKDPELLKDPEMAAKTSAWFMKKNQGAMAKRMGMEGGPKDQTQANLLAASTIAGSVITPGKGYLGGENLDKVNAYSAQLGGVQTPAGAAPSTTAVAAAPVAPPVTGFAPGAQQPAAQPTTLASMAQNVLGSIFGGGGTTAGIAGPTAPAAGSDMAGITAALQAQTAATQTAITSSMENMTTRLVASLGTTGAATGGDPAVPALLGDMISAQREQTAAINRLISVQTA